MVPKLLGRNVAVDSPDRPNELFRSVAVLLVFDDASVVDVLGKFHEIIVADDDYERFTSACGQKLAVRFPGFVSVVDR